MASGLYNALTAGTRGAQAGIRYRGQKAELGDYMAKTQAKTNMGGGDLAGYYQGEMRKKNYQTDLQNSLPFVQQFVKIGNIDGLTKMNDDLKAKYPDLHKTELTGLMPGQKISMQTHKTGAELIAEDPRMQGQVDPSAEFTVFSEIGANGPPRILKISPYKAEKEPLEEWTDFGYGQKKNRRTGDIESVPVKPSGKGGAGRGGGGSKAVLYSQGHKHLLRKLTNLSEKSIADIIDPISGGVDTNKLYKVLSPAQKTKWDRAAILMEGEIDKGMSPSPAMESAWNNASSDPAGIR